MSLRNFFLKSKLTYKIYLYYNLLIRHRALVKRKYYSQWGEDVEIFKYFKNKKKRKLPRYWMFSSNYVQQYLSFTSKRLEGH